jgi:HTH-type transcriptional regulator/antitoxin HipB
MACPSMTPVTLRLRELREARGWSQSELARASGVGQSAISRLEAGERSSISFADLERLADALDVDAAVLIVHEHKRGRR